MTAMDLALFRWANGVAVSPALDPVMVTVTDARVWKVLLLGLVLVLILRRDRRSLFAALALVLSVALSDSVASHVLKPLVGRLRPCHALEGVRLLVHCGGRNGFPSNHAANAAAAAAALGFFFPRTLWLTVPLALLVAWSRVYVGVHYPGDVGAGLLLGLLAGGVTGWFLSRRVAPRLAENAFVG